MVRLSQKLLEYLDRIAVLWRFAPPELLEAVGRHLHDPLLDCYRVHEPHGVVLEEGRELALERPEAAGLDFYQQAVADDIHEEAADVRFQLIARARVPLLERRVQRSLAQRADAGVCGLAFHQPDILRSGREKTRWRAVLKTLLPAAIMLAGGVWICP